MYTELASFLNKHYISVAQQNSFILQYIQCNMSGLGGSAQGVLQGDRLLLASISIILGWGCQLFFCTGTDSKYFKLTIQFVLASTQLV